MELAATIRHYLTSAPSSNFHGQSVEVLDEWQGSENLLWRVRSSGQEAVLKLYLDAGQARSRRQFDGHQTFAPLGIAPTPLWYDRYPTGLARQVLIYHWVPGEPLQFGEIDQRESLAATMATLHNADPAVVRRFCPHPINLDYFWNVLQGSIARIENWLATYPSLAMQTFIRELSQHVATFVEGSLPLWQQAAPTPVHGDLLLENALYHRAQTVLVDWEMFGLGDPALEIAKFLYKSQADSSPEQRAEWQERYHSRSSLPGLPERVVVYQRLLPFQSATYLLLGLPELPARLAELPDREHTIDFLTTTLAASLRQTIAGLQLANRPEFIPEYIETATRELIAVITEQH